MRSDGARFRRRGALAGLLAIGTGIGVAEAFAAFLNAPGPVVAVAQTAIDRAPASAREWAIRTWGESDKTALMIGIAGVLIIAAGALGSIGVRRPWIALGLSGALATVAVLAAASGRYAVRPLIPTVVPSVVAGVIGLGALALLLRAMRPFGVASLVVNEPIHDSGSLDVAEVGTSPLAVSALALRDSLNRRRFLAAAVAVGAIGAGGALVGRVRAARPTTAGFTVPFPTDPAPPLPAGVFFADAALSPFETINRAFYRVDTSARLPVIDIASWRLRVHGMVDRELVLTFDDLLARDLSERDITLTCVSNEVGGPYVGNARWIGAPLADLLREAGIQPGADALKSTAFDGFTVGTPLAAITDGRDAMIAIAMNGEPLPAAHGFPARLVVPGLYGYVSATKWVTDLEVTRFADFTAYWTARGWAEQAPIKTAARIDNPREGAFLSAKSVTIAGVAWAQRRGIKRVEIRVDGGPWMDTELASEASIDTWRQWRWIWNAPYGLHQLQVRATDGTGAVQTGDVAAPVPDGATGWHAVNVAVFDGVPTAPFPARTTTTGPTVI